MLLQIAQDDTQLFPADRGHIVGFDVHLHSIQHAGPDARGVRRRQWRPVALPAFGDVQGGLRSAFLGIMPLLSRPVTATIR